MQITLKLSLFVFCGEYLKADIYNPAKVVKLVF